MIYGIVCDEWGNPISSDNAEVLFETASGKILASPILLGQGPRQNYRLLVPMDAGLTSDIYKPTAMRPTMPFRIRVKVGREVYLPIEVHVDGAKIGEAGEKTRLDLTLGEDLDGDGIPDSWEKALIGRGFGDDLASVDPDGDADGDGLSNFDEYLAGSYAFDDTSGFELEIKGFSQGVTRLEFLAVAGRSYRVMGSDDLDQWTDLAFRLTTDEEGVPLRPNLFFESDVQRVEIEVPPGEDGRNHQFFKLKVE